MILRFSAEQPVIRGQGHSLALKLLFRPNQEECCVSHSATCWWLATVTGILDEIAANLVFMPERETFILEVKVF